MAVPADDHRRRLADRHRTRPPSARRADRGRGERRLNQLAERLRATIARDGPIGVDRFMAEANAHYYATRDPLGTGGDFVTAPEISQMFGELVGAALADSWERAGRPPRARFVELGPGRGTLAVDALRAMRSAELEPAIDLVETSPALRAEQAGRLPHAAWHESIDGVERDGPLLLVANEFLDALPVRQFVGSEERRIRVDGERFAFTIDGAVREESPARDRAVSAIASRLVAQGGVALIIDYGHLGGSGDTLQAVRAHRFADPLADPGEQDLTAHVDFAAVARVAASFGAAVDGPEYQGIWLDRLGIAARAEALGAGSPGRRAELAAAVARLCAPEAMGQLFRVIALRHPDWPRPAGFA